VKCQNKSSFTFGKSQKIKSLKLTNLTTTLQEQKHPLIEYLLQRTFL